ncbi:MAG: glycosyltransferase family 39 protein [Candidatus Hydrogenedentota bacterium]
MFSKEMPICKLDRLATRNPQFINLLLCIILFIASFLRIYKLDTIPGGFFCDEAATGYNTYSILKTGYDPYNRFLPLFMNHHNIDYPEALYNYLSLPVIYLFGLNIFSTRLTSAIISIFSIITTYLFTKELFNKKVGLITAILLTVSPWHFQFSRIAFRAILLPFFTTLSLYLLLKSLKNPRYFILGGLVLGLSLYTYSVSRVFIPLMLIIFFTIYIKDILQKENIKYIILTLFLFFLIIIPVYYSSFFGKANIRFGELSIFNTPYPLKQFFLNLRTHLSFNFLFIKGDANLRHNIPLSGQILVAVIPFFLLGLYPIIKWKSKQSLLLLCLFIAGFIPSSLTNEGIPHSLRSISSLPFAEIIAGYGIFVFLEYLKDRKRLIRVSLSVIFISLIIVDMIFYLSAYFFMYEAISQDWFQYGLKEAIEYAEGNYDRYDNIVLSSKIHYAYIFPLFFGRLDPVNYQKYKSAGKYMVCDENVETFYNKLRGNNLFIVTEKELQNLPVKKYIYNMKNKIVLKLIEQGSPFLKEFLEYPP